MKNDITITVSGSVNTGKSSIAKLIKLVLSENGIVSHIDDFDGDNEVGNLYDLVTKLKAIANKGGDIEIKTVQKQRKTTNEAETA